MEKTNKYYRIIENLVKQNNKYPGYEAILEDIIDDVYSHSEVVINSISNEDVINAYLIKVISTSIITVPKKLNFHKELSHATITTQPAIEKNNIVPNEEKSPKIDLKTELVEKMINGTSSELSLNIDTEKTSIEEPCIENIEKNNYETLDNSEHEKPKENVEEIISDTNEMIENAVEESFEINSLAEEESEIKCETNQDLETFNLDEQLNIEETIEENDNENTLDIETNLQDSEELSLQNESSDNKFLTEEVKVEDFNPNVDENSILIETPALELEEVEFINSNESNDIEELASLDINDSSDEDLLLENNNDNLEIIETDNTLEELNIIDSDSSNEVNTTANSSCKLPDYSIFNYNVNSQEIEMDTENIKNDIIEIDNKYPNLQIINVYNLKYKENCSIEEIASKLDMERSDVINSLNEIISVI